MRWIRPAEVVPLNDSERRKEHRFAAEGEIHFCFDDPGPLDICGKLLDYSRSGFRVGHDYTALAAGQIVTFSHFLTSGMAQVVWNRILPGTVESGFVILDAKPKPEE